MTSFVDNTYVAVKLHKLLNPAMEPEQLAELFKVSKITITRMLGKYTVDRRHSSSAAERFKAKDERLNALALIEFQKVTGASKGKRKRKEDQPGVEEEEVNINKEVEPEAKRSALVVAGKGRRDGVAIDEPILSVEQQILDSLPNLATSNIPNYIPPSFSVPFGSGSKRSSSKSVPNSYSTPFGSQKSSAAITASASAVYFPFSPHKNPAPSPKSSTLVSSQLSSQSSPSLPVVETQVVEAPPIPIAVFITNPAPLPFAVSPSLRIATPPTPPIIPASSLSIPSVVQDLPATFFLSQLHSYARLIPLFELEGVSSEKELKELAQLDLESIDLFLRQIVTRCEKAVPSVENLSGLQRIKLGSIIKALDV